MHMHPAMRRVHLQHFNPAFNTNSPHLENYGEVNQTAIRSPQRAPVHHLELMRGLWQRKDRRRPTGIKAFLDRG